MPRCFRLPLRGERAGVRGERHRESLEKCSACFSVWRSTIAGFTGGERRAADRSVSLTPEWTVEYERSGASHRCMAIDDRRVLRLRAGPAPMLGCRPRPGGYPTLGNQ